MTSRALAAVARTRVPRSIAVFSLCLFSGGLVALNPDPVVAALAIAAVAAGSAVAVIRPSYPLAVFFVAAVVPASLVNSEVNPTSQLTVLKDAYLALMLVATACDVPALRDYARRFTMADAVAAFLIVAYWLYMPLAPSLTQGLFGFKVTFWYMSLFFVGRVYAPRFIRENRLVVASWALYVAFAVWLATSALLFFDSLPLQADSGRFLWSPATRVRFSAGMEPVAIGALFCLWLLLWNSRFLARAAAIAALVPIAVVVVLADNRTAFVTVTLGAIVLVLIRVRERRAGLLTSTLVALALIAGLIFAFEHGYFEPGGPLQLVTLDSRLDEQLGQILPTISSNPLGTGAGVVSGTQATLSFKELTSGEEERVFFHSGYFSLAIELGIIPGIALLGFVGYVIFVTTVVAVTARGRIGAIAAISAVTVLAFAVSDFVNPALYQFPLNAIAWLWAGVGLSTAESLRE